MRTLLLIPMLVLTISGCSMECTLIDAPSYLSIDLNPPVSDAGTWDVALEGDLTAACTLVLPLVAPEDVSCDSDNMNLELTDGYDAIEGILLYNESPDALTVSLTLDGTLVSSQDLAPVYEVDEPNGKGCGERRSATVEIDPSGATG